MSNLLKEFNASVTNSNMLDQRKVEERTMYDSAYAGGSASFTYEKRKSFLYESEYIFCERLKQLVKGKRVLELGMGDGSHSILAAQSCASQVVGIDISPVAVALAKQNANVAGMSTLVSFFEADIETLSSDIGKFDVVIDHEVLSSLNWDTVIPKITELLNNDGVLLGIECLNNNFVFRLNRWLGRINGSRTAWSTQNIMRYEDLHSLNKAYDPVYVSSHHLLLVFIYPLIRFLPAQFRSQLTALVSRIDRYVLKVRQFQPFAFKVIFELKKHSI